MAFKKILLHIGVEKTGSTTIQQTCLGNRDRLNQSNCFYPASMGVNGNHTKLAFYAADYRNGYTKTFLKINNEEELNHWREKTRTEYFAELETAQSDLLILSCEWLAHLLKEEQEFKRLKDLLLPITENIEVVFYIRRQDHLAVSRYSTRLKGGYADPFDFPHGVTAAAGLYDFFGIYEKWSNHFPDVTVRTFDREHLYKQDLLADFFHLCDLEYEEVCEIRSERTHNPSLSRDGQSLLIEFNKLMQEIVTDDSPVDRKTAKLIDDFRQTVSQLMPGKYHPCSRSEAMLFAEMFNESNEELRLAKFPNRNQLFTSDFSDYEA